MIEALYMNMGLLTNPITWILLAIILIVYNK